MRIEHGDCLDVMRRLRAEGVRVDSIVTDPPYHLTSIVKRFGAEGAAPAQHGSDGAYARQSRGFMGKIWDGGDVAYRVETWRLACDLLKPGGYIVAFNSTRGWHRMACAIEDAGFITHPMLGWIFGTGFPKATRLKAPNTDHLRYGGQALKPSLEPVYMGQKPMEGTGTENWLQHGTGALNIGACRIATTEGPARPQGKDIRGGKWSGDGGRSDLITGGGTGRWPANLIHDGSDEVVAGFPAKAGAFAPVRGTEPSGVVDQVYGDRERVAAHHHGDSGSAARFFYAAKASKDDRAGSKHPTVKPVKLMRWLVKLVTPPGGLVLDPFAGSGTTGVAAIREGFRVILIEREDEYVQDIRNRLDALTDEAGLFAERSNEGEE